MTTPKTQRATETNQTPAPTIAALPEPTRDFLAEINTLTKQLDDATARGIALTAQLRAMEENPLLFAMRHMDAGSVLIEAGAELQALTGEVIRRQEKGSLTLKIDVKPFKGEALVLVPVLKVTQPKADPPQSVFYANADGVLTREDPRQMELKIR